MISKHNGCNVNIYRDKTIEANGNAGVFQLPANHLASMGNSIDKLPSFGKLPIKAKGFPNLG